MSSGVVYWITGLAGSGKTTIGSKVYENLLSNKTNVVFLDGDVLRGVFGGNAGHDIENRKVLAMSYARLCKMLSDQGIDVVCSTMSLFSEVHDFNRNNIDNYFEVFVHCDFEELKIRDQKGLYSKALRGDIKNVIGVDLDYDEPKNCDLRIDNTVKLDLDITVKMILSKQKEK